MTPPLIFDRLLLRARRQRGLRLGPETFLLDQVADELAHRLRLVLRQFGVAVDLGTPTDAVRAALLCDGAISTMIALDPMIGPLPCPLANSPLHVGAGREGAEGRVRERSSGDHEATVALRVVADEEA